MISCAAIALLLGLVTNAHADFVFDLATGNSAISGFTGPYAQVDVNLTSSTTAKITFTSLTNSGNIYLMGGGAGQGSAAVAVNVAASSFSVSSLSASNAGSNFSAPSLTVHSGSAMMDGFGGFNLGINNVDGFKNSFDTISFVVTNTSGTWASAANVLTKNGHGSMAAAHIFVTSFPANQKNGASVTGFASGAGTGVVPEPSSLILFGLGVLALVIVMRRHLLPAIDDPDERLAA